MSPSQEADRFQSMFYKAQLAFWDCWLIHSLKVQEVETDVQLSSLMRWKMCYECILCKQSAETGRAKKRSWRNGLDKKIPVVRRAYPSLVEWRTFDRELWDVIVGMGFVSFRCFGWEYAILAQTLLYLLCPAVPLKLVPWLLTNQYRWSP